ncbi:MAG: Rid family detoxifying hydrolase [Elusimicrobiales bacterium]|nr:Rid family detoxifying hydrolase [Elusimicrobiales bacterium]
MKKLIATPNAPSAIGPYSQAVEANGFIFISGQLPIDPASGNMAAPDIRAQTETVLKNLQAILVAEGLTMQNVLKTTVYMTDLKQFAQMNEVYGAFFAANPPARATIGVRALPRMAMVEIEAVAAR